MQCNTQKDFLLARAHFASLLTVAIVVLSAVGCSSGNSKSDSSATPAASPASSNNSAPTITGTPPTTAPAGSLYQFRPTATDTEGNTLVFSITNLPAWATFDTTTGTINGTPQAANIGAYQNIVISVSDGTASTSLAAYTIQVTAAANRAPTITGTPLTSTIAGSSYVFQPVGADADGDPLTYSIVNLPNWATFNSATGRLSGTTATSNVGTYSRIVISVSDGHAIAALPTFTITVAQMATGSATLNWTPPTQNSDGSALVDLAGYKIVYGTSSSSLSQQIDLATAGLTSYVVQNLASGTYYFALKAYNTTGIESDLSNIASKTIP